MIYLLKTLGTDHISDYIQLRDSNFALLAFFSFIRMKPGFENFNISYTDDLQLFIDSMPWGVIRSLPSKFCTNLLIDS